MWLYWISLQELLNYEALKHNTAKEQHTHAGEHIKNTLRDGEIYLMTHINRNTQSISAAVTDDVDKLQFQFGFSKQSQILW